MALKRETAYQSLAKTLEHFKQTVGMNCLLSPEFSRKGKPPRRYSITQITPLGGRLDISPCWLPSQLEVWMEAFMDGFKRGRSL